MGKTHPAMKYKLQDLIDMKQVQSLQDRLNEIYPFPASIVDNEGNVLTSTAWQDICAKFHRQHPECLKECIKSDRYILEHLAEANPAVSYRCPHGLYDNATPIMIDGEHMGNFFIGQFFLEKPDPELFRQQARRYGFDEDAYMQAVRKVPIWTAQQVKGYLLFIKGLVEVIGNIGLKNLRVLQTADSLRESEERHRSIVQTAMDGFWRVDLQGRILEANEAYCRMSGYSLDELLTMRISDVEAIETPEETAERIRQVVAKGPARFESKQRRKDGTIYDVEVSAQYHPTGGGYFVAFLRDITERKRTVEALRKSEESLRFAFEGSTDAFYDQNLVTGEQTNSPLWAEITGYPLEQLDMPFPRDPAPPPTTVTSLIHPDDVAAIAVSFQDHLEGRTPVHIAEYRLRTESGEWKWILDRCKVVEWDKDGRPVRVAGTHTDISERKQAEDTLRATESRQRAMIANISDVIAILDEHGTNRYKSPNIEKWFGWRPEELIGAPTWDNVHPDDVPQVKRVFVALLNEANSSATDECRYRCKDGTYKWIEFTAVNLLHDPMINGILVNYHDISERRQAEEEKQNLQGQLMHAQKMESVGRLAGGVAHDFNNMLGVIIGHTELAIERSNPDDPLYVDLQEVRKAAERSAALTRQLLAFARKQNITPKVLDLNETVEGMLKMLRRLIGEDIDLAWLPGHTPSPVRIDPSQIDQILANLCVNARDAIGGVGKVTIETNNASFDEAYCNEHVGSSPGNYVMLAVADDGCGMDKTTLDMLFEPFFTTKEVGQGTGLGLATVYGIVKQNNGFIQVSSERGHGTTFRIYLPCHNAMNEPQATDAAEGVIRGRETILLVEDEPAILNLGRRMLETLGYRVISAKTPDEAMEAAHQYGATIDLLMTDVIMPGMNGRDLARHILSACPGMRCLFMSGYTADVIASHEVLDEGMNFIQKPFSVRDLSIKIRQALG